MPKSRMQTDWLYRPSKMRGNDINPIYSLPATQNYHKAKGRKKKIFNKPSCIEICQRHHIIIMIIIPLSSLRILPIVSLPSSNISPYYGYFEYDDI